MVLLGQIFSLLSVVVNRAGRAAVTSIGGPRGQREEESFSH